MTKCPFCHYENEDGALFCERCSSDLSTAAPAKPAPPPPPPKPAMPMPMPMPMPTTGHEHDIPIAMAEPLPAGSAGAMDAIPMAVAEPLDPFSAPFAQPMPALDLAPMAEAMPAAELAPVHSPAPPTPPPMTEAPAALAAPSAPAAAPLSDAKTGAPLPPGSQPRLLVLRGQKRNVEYPIFEGQNYVGRADEKPVDIDLEEQEPPDRIWCSRQHAVLLFDNGTLTLEDLNSANGTYINRTRVYPGQPKALAVNDIIQIGNVQMKVII